MHLASLVLLLHSDEDARSSALCSLTEDERICVGEPIGSHFPIAVATDSAREGADLVRWLAELPGVVNVDVVRVDFERGCMTEAQP